MMGLTLPDISAAKVVAIDTETTGLEWYRNDRPFGIAISCDDDLDWYGDIREDARIVPWLQDQVLKMAERKTTVVNHHLKFDIHMLKAIDVDLTILDWEQMWCTMINAALLDEHRLQYSLDSLAKDYLGEKKFDEIYQYLADEFGGEPTRKAQMPNLCRAESRYVAPYAKKDTRLAIRLWRKQMELIEQQNLHDVVHLERELFPCVIDMEWQGIRVDPDQADRTMYELEQKIDKMRREIDHLAGFPVNPNPSGSIRKLFDPIFDENKKRWYAIDGTPLATTKAGAPSMGKDALKLFTHPAAKLIIECRKLMKAKDTFLKRHVKGHMVKREDGHYYVHPNINQTKGDETGGTGTGRLSYTGPALQQIPARDIEVAKLVRPVFLPDPGEKWSYADAEQQEFRVFAHYANSPGIINGYANDVYMDMHQKVADMTGLPRKAPESGGANAKQLNLGMVFNMGAGELASQMGLPFEFDEVDFRDGRGPQMFKRSGPEAIDVMEQYYSNVPGVREVAKKARAIAKARGHVRTLWGRHIRFPGGRATHKASGVCYQGTSADLMKVNIIRTFRYMKEMGYGRLLLVIHDEENISIPEMDHDQTVSYLSGLKEYMQDFQRLRVPIVYDWSAPSDNWWEANCAKEVTNGWSKPMGIDRYS